MIENPGCTAPEIMLAKQPITMKYHSGAFNLKTRSMLGFGSLSSYFPDFLPTFLSFFPLDSASLSAYLSDFALFLFFPQILLKKLGFSC
jgi:hypothetical protein